MKYDNWKTTNPADAELSYCCAVCGRSNAITYHEAMQGFDTCEKCVPRGKWHPYDDTVGDNVP